jgi:hypothetical protein
MEKFVSIENVGQTFKTRKGRSWRCAISTCRSRKASS